MINIFTGILLATLTGIGATAYYGAENLLQHPWVEQAVWIFIGAGMLAEAGRWLHSLLNQHVKKSASVSGQEAAGWFERSSNKETYADHRTRQEK